MSQNQNNFSDNIERDTMTRVMYKVCIVGDGAVGKTTILHRYVDRKFSEDTMMTIGTNFFMKEVILPEVNTIVKLQIWDLGGQQHFAVVRPNFYLGARGIIYTFDLTRRSTLNNLLDWKTEICNVIGNGFPSILVGNKLDLIEIEQDRIIASEDAAIIQQDLSSKDYIETSAKTDIGIDSAFRKLALYVFNSLSHLL